MALNTTEDIVETFCDLDLSKDQSAKRNSTNSTSSSRDTKAVAKYDPNADALFFRLLPIEIRLRIYKQLLVSCLDDEDAPRSWFVGDINACKCTQERTMHLAILRTCTRVYNEAIHILYIRFIVSRPHELLDLHSQMGPRNFKMIQNLWLLVGWPESSLNEWLSLMKILAEEADGLRSIDLFWLEGTNGANGHVIHKNGLGDNVQFVRALGNIRGLENLRISGYYAKTWHEYLEHRMGIKVMAVHGYPNTTVFNRLKPNLSSDEFYADQVILFNKYQQGIEGLMP